MKTRSWILPLALTGTLLVPRTDSALANEATTAAAALIARGDALDSALKTAEALDAYREAERLQPDDPRLLIKIAKQYGESMVDLTDKDRRREAGETALEYARRALALDPGLADAHLAVAICYGRLLDLSPARQKVEYSRQIKIHTEKAIAIDARSDYAWHLLGRWHRAVAETGALLRGLVQVVYGGLPDATLPEAAAAFEKAVSLNPGRVSHHIELGLTYAAMGREADAKAALQRGLALPARERDDPDTKARGRAVLATLSGR